MRTFRSQLAEARKPPTSIADLAPRHSPRAHEILRANLGRSIRASASAAAEGKPMKASERARRERVYAILGRREGDGSWVARPRQKAAREAERAARALGESHTRAELEALKPSTLRALHKKYSGKGDSQSKREAGVIADVLRQVNEQHGGALRALARANAADLKEYPGAKGKRAHKRLHSVIGKFLKRKSVDEACWKGYTQVGMKTKGGKRVPNCVPQRGGKPAPQRPVDEAAMKADSATLRRKYDKHEGSVISRLDYPQRGRRGDDTPAGRQRLGRQHTAMSLIQREMERRGERVGYRYTISPEIIAASRKREQQERDDARREREERESNPVYQRNLAKFKARLAAKKKK